MSDIRTAISVLISASALAVSACDVMSPDTNLSDLQLFCEYPDRGRNPDDCPEKIDAPLRGVILSSNAYCDSYRETLRLLETCASAVRNNANIENSCRVDDWHMPTSEHRIKYAVSQFEQFELDFCETIK